MANALRDHVWFIDTNGLVGNAGKSDAMEKIRTIRWLPAAGGDTITIERIKEDGTSTEVIWESAGGGTTAPQESRLDIRFTRGMKVTQSAGGKLYLYEALDGPTAK